jgi:class 3 adenylate cyclase
MLLWLSAHKLVRWLSVQEREEECVMDFYEVLDQVLELLRQRGRVSYRALKRQFGLDDAYLEDLKVEIIKVHQLAADQDGAMLVWTGGPTTEPAPAKAQERAPLSYTPRHLAEKILTSCAALEGEHKQVTVLFCDLANSTALAERLGPEAMHTLLNQFFELALGEVHRYEGTINQFLGDGFMALFGAPIAHEDSPRRAVHAALGMQRAIQDFGRELQAQRGFSIQMRIGLNTGLVVGKIGDDRRMDYTEVGDTTKGRAAELAGVTRWRFQELLAQRGMHITYEACPAKSQMRASSAFGNDSNDGAGYQHHQPLRCYWGDGLVVRPLPRALRSLT